MTVVDFISSVYADLWYLHDEKPGPITEGTAADMITEYKDAGTDVPEWLTPEAFAAVWNLYCKM